MVFISTGDANAIDYCALCSQFRKLLAREPATTVEAHLLQITYKNFDGSLHIFSLLQMLPNILQSDSVISLYAK